MTSEEISRYLHISGVSIVNIWKVFSPINSIKQTISDSIVTELSTNTFSYILHLSMEQLQSTYFNKILIERFSNIYMILRNTTSNKLQFDRYTYCNFKQHIYENIIIPLSMNIIVYWRNVKLASLECYDGTCRHSAII